MAKYVTHTITVHHKDGLVRQHHVMASDDASAIHQVPIDPKDERIVGIRRSEHADKESPQITHAVSFRTNDLFGGDGHVATHYVSLKRGSIEKEIEKMTKKNPQLGTPLGAHKIAEGERITYSDLKVILESMEGRRSNSEQGERTWVNDAAEHAARAHAASPHTAPKPNWIPKVVPKAPAAHMIMHRHPETGALKVTTAGPSGKPFATKEEAIAHANEKHPKGSKVLSDGKHIHTVGG